MAMAPLDDLVQRMQGRGRDDGWVVLPGGMGAVLVLEEILESRHSKDSLTRLPLQLQLLRLQVLLAGGGARAGGAQQGALPSPGAGALH